MIKLTVELSVFVDGRGMKNSDKKIDFNSSRGGSAKPPCALGGSPNQLAHPPGSPNQLASQSGSPNQLAHPGAADHFVHPEGLVRKTSLRKCYFIRKVNPDVI